MTLTTPNLRVRVDERRLAKVSLGFLVVATVVLQGAFARMRSWYSQHEPLVVARCEVRCWNDDDRNACVKDCLSKGIPKPGFCPDKNTHHLPFSGNCVKNCEKDSQCGGVAKCCPHGCGTTCQMLVNLDFVEGLPETPKEPKVIEGRRKRTVHIEWTPVDLAPEPGRQLYLIEERHHAGKYYNSNLLTNWNPCSKSFRSNRLLKHFVKPGRWYQFRIAAINENGTRGFSESSLPFRVSANPKPPQAPQNVTVGPLVKTNGSLNVLLEWTPPISDLPIERYKVFWSRRLQGAKALDSVLVQQQVLPKDTTHFLIQGLQPNSQYFLQVQGLLQYGKERLKGEKSGLVLNTTDFVNDSMRKKYTSNKNKLESGEKRQD
ncbi:anosmin-1 isoform X2 [Diabrotica virgifera virgifera]|uniref:Anosmin-1 n=1 Tax=Diabrotica virgifera virgifera TaxID=50390 RepID=A0ABM5JIW7_DIAVI|nr:anosmin-1 isoform X2 [Diabrotica virgifera virgifera]